MIPKSIIGAGVDRVDGPLKVTGGALYAGDISLAGMVYAVPVLSTIARGNIVSMDTQAATQAPGVLSVITRENAPPLFKGGNDYSTAHQAGENWMPLQDDEIYYDGQIIGLVVADTLERAVGAAELVKTSYQSCRPMVDLSAALKKPDTTQPSTTLGQKLQYQRGDVETALAKSAVRIEQTYTTPIQHHNPLEPHASVAEWSDNGLSLTLHETSQWVVNSRNTISRMLGIDQSAIKVRVLSPFLGGGFGCKGYAWAFSALAAASARELKRPVKLVLSRRQMYSLNGHRPSTTQTVTLGADRRGRLKATRHLSGTYTSKVFEYIEPVVLSTQLLYKCSSLQTGLDLARMNTGTPTPMRGPGETPGLFALESAMDELAVATGVDPIELRLRNYAERDPRTNNRQPWSSKNLRECYVRGAEEFGWENRPKVPASRREGRWLIGYGMASATYPAQDASSDVLVRLTADGRAEIEVASHDLGTGTYTILSQFAAAELDLPISKVSCRLADTLLPPGPCAGGSQTVASVGQAVIAACRDSNLQLDRKAGRAGHAKASFPSSKPNGFSWQSFGAQFAEVRIDAELGRIRVHRFLGIFDPGRVINEKTARSQVHGGIIQGIGMALMEETALDPYFGRVMTPNLADYHFPVNADIHGIRVSFIDKPDPHFGPLGARGLGELPLTGAATAVANAVFNATGIRLRDLPMLPEKLRVGKLG
jgi:xanthine dehydrogenase YagR molybdenum-binding subunit